jgi:hypothetical protein
MRIRYISRSTPLALLLALATGGAAGCDGFISGDDPDDGGGGDGDGDGDGDGEAELECEGIGMSYTGIGGSTLEVGRPLAEVGSDHRRLTPFSAMAARYRRALGSDAADVGAFEATFGNPPARWYEEPSASADTLYASFTIAYQGCLALTATGPTFAAAPTEATATTVCTDLARQFWSRTPADDEIAPCVEYAVNETGGEPDPRRRWAYTCASVLSAAGFLSY